MTSILPVSPGGALHATAGVTVRPALVSEGPLIAALSAPFVAQDRLVARARAHLSGRVGEFLIAERDGTAVGCVGLTGCRRELLVYNLCIAADWQRLGIGRLLLDHAVSTASLGGHQALLAVSKHDSGTWFVRQGFRTVDLRTAPAEWLACLQPGRNSLLYRLELR